MINYLKFESDLITNTNGHFDITNTSVRKTWYVVKDKEIFEFGNLATAMLKSPDYIIFDRFDNITPTFNFTRLYFDKNLNQIQHIVFNNWRLGEASFDYYNNLNTYILIDPLGEERKVKLSSFFPYIYSELKEYIMYDSYKSYDSKETV